MAPRPMRVPPRSSPHFKCVFAARWHPAVGARTSRGSRRPDLSFERAGRIAKIIGSRGFRSRHGAARHVPIHDAPRRDRSAPRYCLHLRGARVSTAMVGVSLHLRRLRDPLDWPLRPPPYCYGGTLTSRCWRGAAIMMGAFGPAFRRPERMVKWLVLLY